MSLNTMSRDCHHLAVAKGWYDTERGFPELIALMHSELSEALEAYRNADSEGIYEMWFTGASEDNGGKPEGVPVELVDCIIRILDTACYYGMDLDAAYAAKMRYNESRKYRHGGKRG